MRGKNIVTCLLGTMFALTFTVYALYKYSLIDPEAVLYKNLLFSEDKDDYGIDVSHLRGLETGEAADARRDTLGPISSVEEWDAIVKKDSGIRISYVTDSCDNPTVVYGIAYLTKADVGVKAVVLVNYTAEEEMDKGQGEAVIVGSFGKASLINQTMELCSLDDELIQCPVEKGFRAYRREVALPKFAPKGRYRGSASLRYKGSTKSQLCARGTMIL